MKKQKFQPSGRSSSKGKTQTNQKYDQKKKIKIYLETSAKKRALQNTQVGGDAVYIDQGRTH